MIIHEKDISSSIDANIIGTANIVKKCSDKKIKLIYFSTNYVYPGTKGNYSESDPILPINNYRMVSGKLEFFRNKFQITHPSNIENVTDIQLLREKEPVYSLTAGLNMKTFIKLSNQVKEAGGLAIIGTERHDSRRVDRQLRGRSGRQGDEGSSIFYVSLEDDLMRIFGSESMNNLSLIHI